MCGIAGFCNMPEHWHENIARMNERMIHRGPDAGGIWASDDLNVVLGHRRLSIVDLSDTGAQPMISASGRYVMIQNGEIYNHNEIRKKILKENNSFNFRGTSDTEVFLEACELYGLEETLKIVKGMFAIALYDKKTKKLCLARDRMGEKPLYYGYLDGKFVFASDIAVISRNLYFEEKLDKDALMLYLGCGYIPAPYTIYKNIKKLEAGSILTISYPFRENHIHKYWDIKQIAWDGQRDVFNGTEEDAANYLDHLLQEAIKGQMMADVPVGAFLSGGIDSATVVAIMQSLSTHKVKTFTIGFEDHIYNEAKYAREIADFLGTTHTELYISDKDAQEIIPKLPHIYGEPFADSSQIPTYLVSKLARESVTVSLSGDGGDELFGGYNTYSLLDETWKRMRFIPLFMRKGIGGILNNTDISQLKRIARYLPAASVESLYELTKVPTNEIKDIIKNPGHPEVKSSNHMGFFMEENINNMMLMDMLVYHPDDILVKVDRAGMAVSLESRIPMLDRDVIEFAWKLPLEYKRNKNEGKKVLKRVLYRYVPKQMMERSKKGFSVPIGKWVREGALREWAEDLLDENLIRQQGIFDEKKIRKIWSSFLKSGVNDKYIWYILMFEEWIRSK